MKQKGTIEKELRKLERMRVAFIKADEGRDSQNFSTMYGAAQALGWVLSKNYATASSCVIPPKKKKRIARQ